MTRKEQIYTVVLGVLLAAVVLCPALVDLDGNIPGVRHSEAACGAWIHHGAQEAILEHGELPLVHHDTAHRDGGRLFPLALLNTLLTLPLYPLLGFAGVYSISQALNVALAFIFAVMLFRDLGGCWWATLPGAVLFSLSPYMISHIAYGPAESSTYAWIALVVLAAERLAASERSRPGLAVLTGLLVAACFAGSAYSGIFATIVVMFSLLTRGIALRKLWRRGIYAALALVAATALIAPLAVAHRYTGNHPNALDSNRELRVSYGLHDTLLDEWTVQDAANFVWPTDRFHNTRHQPVMYVGLLALVLVLVAMVRVRAARRWGWLALGGMVFCLGGVLQVAGTTPEILGDPIRMPAGYLCRLPLMNVVSHPFRLQPVVLIALGAAITLLLARGGAQGGGPRRWQAVTLSALFVVEMGMMYPEGPFRMPVMDVTPPSYYQELGEAPGDYAVLDVPVGRNPRTICDYFLYQLEHDKFVPYDFSGVTVDPESDAGIFVAALVMPNEMEFGDARLSGEFRCSLRKCAGAGILRDLGYRYLVLHRLGEPRLDVPLQECVERCLPYPIHEDDQVRVYEF